jgi:hypothetical protein
VSEQARIPRFRVEGQPERRSSGGEESGAAVRVEGALNLPERLRWDLQAECVHDG